jgi:uncharacterized membrane protein YraQ (UPF0718 family)
MDIISLLQYTLGKVVETLSHNWFLLLISIVVSVALKLYVDQDAIARFLQRNTKNSVLMSTGVAVATPFCSCGTTAVILGMMASTVPWAPIVAFLVSSPLTSPQELFYSAGLFGWRFAIAFFIASILLAVAEPLPVSPKRLVERPSTHGSTQITIATLGHHGWTRPARPACHRTACC